MRLVAEVIRISYAKFRCNRLTTVGYKISNITRVSFFDTQFATISQLQRNVFDHCISKHFLEYVAKKG